MCTTWIYGCSIEYFGRYYSLIKPKLFIQLVVLCITSLITKELSIVFAKWSSDKYLYMEFATIDPLHFMKVYFSMQHLFTWTR